MGTRARPSVHAGNEDLGRVNGKARDGARAGNPAPEYGEPGNDKPELPPRPYVDPFTKEVKKDSGGLGRQAEEHLGEIDFQSYGANEPPTPEEPAPSTPQPGINQPEVPSPSAPQPGITQPETAGASRPQPGINRPETASATTPQPGINRPETAAPKPGEGS